jgi:hypothetical protein
MMARRAGRARRAGAQGDRPQRRRSAGRARPRGDDLRRALKREAARQASLRETHSPGSRPPRHALPRSDGARSAALERPVAARRRRRAPPPPFHRRQSAEHHAAPVPRCGVRFRRRPPRWLSNTDSAPRLYAATAMERGARSRRPRFRLRAALAQRALRSARHPSCSASAGCVAPPRRSSPRDGTWPGRSKTSAAAPHQRWRRAARARAAATGGRGARRERRAAGDLSAAGARQHGAVDAARRGREPSGPHSHRSDRVTDVDGKLNPQLWQAQSCSATS